MSYGDLILSNLIISPSLTSKFVVDSGLEQLLINMWAIDTNIKLAVQLKVGLLVTLSFNKDNHYYPLIAK